MEPSLGFLLLFSLVMTVVKIDARSHPKGYWQDPYYQSVTSVSPLPITKGHCDTLAERRNYISSMDSKSKQRPNNISYDNDENPDAHNHDIDPRTNILVYDTDIGLESKKNVDEDFEPRPNLSVYDNDTGLKGKKLHNEEFEPRPNLSVYDKDTNFKGKWTSEDFEPRPNLSIYDNDAYLRGKKISDQEVEPKPNISIYDKDID